MWKTFTETTIAGNEVWRLLAFCILVLVCLVVGRLARLFMDRAAAGRGTGKPDWMGVALGSLAKPVPWVAFALGLKLGVVVLTLGPGLQSLAWTVCGALNAVAMGYVVYSLVDLVDYYLGGLAQRTESKVDDVLAPLVGRSLRITVLVVVLTSVAHVISGKDVTAILAGLGVGGLAVALAGQDTIKNFFGSMVILGDKPFEMGDRIVVDGHDGPVESVGFRSTKIRTLDGHLVTIPNSEMVNRSVQNIGKRPYIKRVANITVTYDTPPDKMRRALQIIRDELAGHEGMAPEFPPRVFFNDFNDCSLNIMVIYWYHPPDYWEYLAFSERFNMRILEQFNAEGIEFAFPSQTVYVANDDKRQLAVRTLREQA